MKNNMKIIAGSSNPNLALRLGLDLGFEVLDTKLSKFNDGELKIQVHGLIGKEILLIQSTSAPVNDHLMELLLLADTARRGGAKRIIAVIPYFGYSRQDRCDYKNGPISASVVIKMIEAAGVTEVITLDLHSNQLEGVFNIPIKNLSTQSIFFPVIQGQVNNIVISPDIGGISRARNYGSLLGTDLAIINKSRDLNNVCSMSEIIGDVKGRHCIIIDDIIDGANTVCLATELLLKNGANSVEAIVTHGVLSGDAVAKIQKSALKHLYISDSISNPVLPDKLSVLPTHELLAAAIKLI